MPLSVSKSVELRLPADRDYIVVAKRCASALASAAGFDVESLDELTIAVAQVCENAIECLDRAGALAGEVRLVFKVEDASIEVSVKSTVTREAEIEARVRLDNERRARDRERALLEKQQGPSRRALDTDLALRLMGLLVDDHSYRLDERTGGLRVRLTKYRIS